MPGGYIDLPLSTDPDQLSAEALDYLAAHLPGWVPREGHLEVWLVEVFARMVAEARDVASRVPVSIFRFFGRSLIGLEPIDATSATVNSTWTMVDAAGYTVPTGTVVAFRTAGDVLVSFRTTADVTVTPGNTTTAAVLLEAVVPGEAANGLTGPMELVDTLAAVASVEATTVSAGGVDAETDTSYLNRLSQELELLTPRPILPSDFAVLARRVAGVHRALALDLYDPTTDTWDNERTVTVVVVDADGQPVSAATKDAVAAYLASRREVNFVVHAADPTYTEIDVDTTFVVNELFEVAAVETAVAEAVAAYLSPANWGGGNEDPPEWRASANTIRFLEVAALINTVDGVDYVASLLINGAAADVPLAGPAPLPSVGTISASAVV